MKKDEDKENLPESRTEKVDKVKKGKRTRTLQRQTIHLKEKTRGKPSKTKPQNSPQKRKS